MLNNKNTILQGLNSFKLKPEESKLYLELLKGPASHLELARTTGINRTKVYRLADQLQKRSLVTTRTDDRGTFLVAADPGTLEVELVTQEENLKRQRAIFSQILPDLQSLQHTKDSPSNFVVNTYEGVEGFKQMLWNELKTEGEILIFGFGELESLVESVRWAEKHRTQTVAAGYKIREILNPGGKKDDFTKVDEFMASFTKRFVSPDIINFEDQIAIYNDTVATYHFMNGQKVGFEVVNRTYAAMMRSVFEQLWQTATAPTPKN